jgi:hypothetical protein
MLTRVMLRRTEVGAMSALLVGMMVVGTPGLSWSEAQSVSPVLTVNSEPVGAFLYVDGEPQGETPITVTELSAGSHRIRLVMRGYLENSRVVNLAAGQAETVNVQLTPETSAPPARPDVAPQAMPEARATAGRAGGGGKKRIALIALGAAAIGGGVYLVLPKNKPPVAGTIGASTTSALMGATEVSFNVTGASDPDGDPLTYTWNFGDGQTGSGVTTKHVFSAAGTFSVRLSVADKKVTVEAAPVEVTVKSATGEWGGSLYGARATLSHSGSTITGGYADQFGPGTLSAGKVSAPSRMEFVITQTPEPGYTWVATFTCSFEAGYDVCRGNVNEVTSGPFYYLNVNKNFNWTRR